MSTEQFVPSLGQFVQPFEHRRDAVHIALAPVTAGADLQPGQHVGLLREDNVTLVGPCEEPVGIVDPFLRVPVLKGSRFWLLLYPNTVTGLRHVWTHPAFERAFEAAKEKARGR